ncbi:MFS transporter [Fodinicurvata fenggangensis]|uniref:MFS transporter n=1 Tax=Fodinicurvata fenggangensis TaxID=1121830 RepID=UPI00069073EC|nr:MFS transporter [Fodinicurvata fenggangensis]
MRGLGVIAGTIGVQTVSTMATMILPAIAPLAAHALQVDAALIGLQVSLVYGIAMIASLFGGPMVRSLGACRTSQIGLLLVAAGCLVAFLATIPPITLPALAVASILLGMAYGLPNPAAAHLLMRFTEPEKRNMIFSLKQTGVPLGGMLAGLIGPGMAEWMGWQAPVMLSALLAVVLAVAIQPWRRLWDSDRASTGKAPKLPIEAIRLVFGQPALRLLSLSAFLLAGIQLCIVTFLVVILVEDLGYSPIHAGILLASVQVAGAIGRIGWGMLADRFGNGAGTLLVLLTLLAVTALAVTQITADTPASLTTGIFLMLGATGISWNGIFLAEVARRAPEGRAGDVTSAALFLTYMGVLVGPALFSAAGRQLDSFLPLYGALAAAAILAFAMVRAAQRRGGHKD